MPAKRIPQLDVLTGATSATDDKIVIYDATADTTKAITRQELGKGIVGDLPYTPSGGISATTIPTAIAELDTEAAKSAALAAAGGAALIGKIGSGTVQDFITAYTNNLDGSVAITGTVAGYNYCFNSAINQIAGGNANVIAGGGLNTSDNEILGAADYQTISGGYDNTINGCIASTIAGGAHHVLSAGVTHGTVGGGSYNDITAGDYGTIAGGTGHTVSASEAAICGGNANTVAGQAGFIGAGNTNSITAGLRNSIVGGASNQITGGNDSSIVGGTSNTITSSFSVVGGNGNTAASYGTVFGFQNTSTASYTFAVGRENLASKDYGSAYGYRAVARSTGVTLAGGRIAANGDAQSTDVVGKAVTTSASIVYLNGADNNQFIVPLPADNVAVTVSALLTAVEPATGDSKSFKLEALLKRIGGVNTVVGGAATITVIAADAGAAAWTVGVNLSTNNVRVACIGEAGKTIAWSGKVTAVEVSF